MLKPTFKEDFLQYIWLNQYFFKKDFVTTEGERIEVLSPGFLNKNAGPDFLNSRVIIDKIEWHGAVEIHHKSSDWIKHQHSHNSAYNNVILHVVWEYDKFIEREDGSVIPTVELKTRIEYNLINQYNLLITSSSAIPCAHAFPKIDAFYRTAMIDKCFVERLITKSTEILDLYKSNKEDWEETCYQWLAKSYGFKVNAEPFLHLTRLVPYKLIRKYNNKPIAIESLLFGIAGFLGGESNFNYFNNLKNEFQYLKQKHNLAIQMQEGEWRYFRLRPANFPTLRIAQFSTFLASVQNLFDFVFSSEIDKYKKQLDFLPNPYWTKHYHFAKESNTIHPSKMGKASIENIILNAIVPLKFTYGLLHDKEEYKEAAIEMTKALKNEVNNILTNFDTLNITFTSAYESQGYIQLYNSYCSKKMCLNCTIGSQIIYPATNL